MEQKCHHLTYEDRTVIKVLLQKNKSYSCRARIIGVHKSTISREILRNSGYRGYRNKQAQRKAMKRRSKPRTKKLDEYIKRYIIGKLRQDFSPEHISGISKKRLGITISHESIYQLIVKDKKHGGKLYSAWERGSNENTNGLTKTVFYQRSRAAECVLKSTRSCREID